LLELLFNKIDIELNHHTDSRVFLNELSKSFNKQLELKEYITKKIKSSQSGEQLLWIRKYNSLFIHTWK
tara:strand:+ start:562 stop:768 length:207 start_codon:yes stop_codon:yes gene_type:complete